MVATIFVPEQAKNKGVFSYLDRNTIKFNFSHLYAALVRAPYMAYFGLESAWSGYDQVHANWLERLRDVPVWIYGSKEDDKESVIQSQNPEFMHLG